MVIMKRSYYNNSITNFLTTSPVEIIGKIALKNEFAMEQTQKDAWLAEINILREVINPHKDQFILNIQFHEWGSALMLFS